MISIIDIAILLWFIFLLSNGWNKGFARVAIGPFSLVVGIAASFLYFKKTHNLIALAGGMVLGPVILSFILSIIIRLWHKKVDKSVPPVWQSRLLGSIFNLAWGTGIVVAVMVAIGIIPSNIFRFKGLQESIFHSYFYSLVERPIKDKISFVSDIETVFNVLQDQDKMEKMQGTSEFAAFYRDKKIQDILSDKETLAQIQNKDVQQLSKNQKIIALLQDQKLLEKVLKLSKVILQKESRVKPSLLEEHDPK